MIKLNTCFPVKMRRAVLSDCVTLCDFINYSYSFKSDYITTIKEIHNKPRMTYSMMENSINNSNADIFIYYLEDDNNNIIHSDYYQYDSKYSYFKFENNKDLIGTSCVELKTSCSFFNNELFVKNSTYNLNTYNNKVKEFHLLDKKVEPIKQTENKEFDFVKSKFYLGSCGIHPLFHNKGLGLQLISSNILFIQLLKLMYSSKANLNEISLILEKKGYTLDSYKKLILDYFKVNFYYSNYSECNLYNLKENIELIDIASTIYLFYISTHLERMLIKLGFYNEVTRKKLKEIIYFVENTDLTEYGKEQFAIVREKGIFDEIFYI